MLRHACVLIDTIRLHSDLHILSRWSSKHWNECHLAPDRCEKGHFCLCYEPWFSEGIPGKCELLYTAPFPSLLLLPPTHPLLHTHLSLSPPTHTLSIDSSLPVSSQLKSHLSGEHTLSIQLGLHRREFYKLNTRRKRFTYWEDLDTQGSTWEVACHAFLSTISGSPARVSYGETGNDHCTSALL